MDPRRPREYWRDLREREAGPDGAGGEFPEPLGVGGRQLGRRGFLAAAGLGAVATALTGCNRAPPRHAIPHLTQPPEMVPGTAVHYASTCGGCAAGCGVVAKVRDGRPIKLEGNPAHPVSRGGLCAIGQASLLELYDGERLDGPRSGGRRASWEEVDAAILERLAAARAEGGAVRFLTDTVTSPTLQAQIERFLSRFPDGRHVTYDPLSCSAILEAHEATHGVRVLPRYRLDRAEVIVAFDADFLGTWISPVEFTAGYRAGRDAEARPARFSFHAQLESRMSLTGTKADRRIRIGPGEHGLALTHLVARLSRRAGAAFAMPPLEPSPIPEGDLEDLARRLWEARDRSLILCGSQDVRAQALANLANELLGAYGATLDLDRPSRQRSGDDRELEALRRELEAGRVAALFVMGPNPVHDRPGGARLAEAIRRVPLVVSLSPRLDETARLAHHVCPDHHFMESWGDAEAVSGVVSVYQPLVHPLRDTRAALESLARWSGDAAPSAHELLRESWRTRAFPRQQRERSFEEFWTRSVQRGFAEVEPQGRAPAPFRSAAVRPVAKATRPAPGALALVLYPKVGVLDGRHAANAWLQELPDPVTKVTWDNYACLSPAAAAALGVKDGDVVRLEAGGEGPALELPACVQPGQHDGTVAVALGYGGVLTERFGAMGKRWRWGRTSAGPDGRVGKNAASLLALDGGSLRYERFDVKAARTGASSPLACTQSHHTLTVPRDLPLLGGQRRDIVRETTVGELNEGRGRPEHPPRDPESLWPEDHPYRGHRWHLVVDLAACTGCSACVVACQAENNIPVVGKDEVLRHREMHWLRIDRYYAGDGGEVDVVHQPLMCAQCDNAPCETVCPVLATVHSAEGLNQQVYNRCVGTRYCSNNCPYKARRFNWFDYGSEDRLQDLARNPDVTVRSRGVMEKCTFCVQRIQLAKIEARVGDRGLADGEIRTACEQSCPANAIVFGDLNDPDSRVARLAASPRGYRLLEELNVRPAVRYLAAVRNRDGEGEGGGHG